MLLKASSAVDFQLTEEPLAVAMQLGVPRAGEGAVAGWENPCALRPALACATLFLGRAEEVEPDPEEATRTAWYSFVAVASLWAPQMGHDVRGVEPAFEQP